MLLDKPEKEVVQLSVRSCSMATQECPCGFLTDSARSCTCSPVAIQRYYARISGPILDRIDIHIEVPAVGYGDLTAPPRDSSESPAIKHRVNAARSRQKMRYKDIPGTHANAGLSGRSIDRHCILDRDAERILRRAIDAFGFSARAYHRILKVGRTIADLDQSDHILAPHISEAIQYRTLDRNLWIK